MRLQDGYDCYILATDYQTLGDHVADAEEIRRSVLELVIAWSAVVLYPEMSTLVVQSFVPAHAELTLYLSMLTPLGLLQRNPTFKTERIQIRAKGISVSFLAYPVSQIADILFSKANLAPGEKARYPISR